MTESGTSSERARRVEREARSERGAAEPSPPSDERLRRITRRRIVDRHRIQRAFLRLAQVLDRRRPARTELRTSGDRLFEACRLVAGAQGIRLLPVVASEARLRTSLVELSEANGVRYRKVLLRDTWWRRDNGPLLAFRGGENTGQAVALLPRAGGARYELVDPVSGERRLVDGESGAELGAEAYMFYRPLPARPLRFPDLVRSALSGRWRDLVHLAGTSFGIGLLSLLLPIATGRIVSVAIARSDRTELVLMTVALIAGAVAAALLQAVRGLLVVRLAGKVDGSLQAALWDRLLALPVPFFRQFTVGDLEARSMGIDRIRDLMSGFVTASLLSVVAALFSLAILFYYSAVLAFVAVGSISLLAVFVAVLSGLQLRHQRHLQRLRGRMASLLYALLNGIVKLRVGHAELRAYSTWAERFADLRRLEVLVQRLTNIQVTGGVTYSVATTLALFAMIGYSTSVSIGVGEFVAFHMAFGQFVAAALSIIGVIPTALATVPVYERMVPILETVPEVPRDRINAGPIRGDLELRNVAFQYDASGPPVLDGVSIHAREGELVALVGPSGSGKSTCLRLMLGFEQPARGRVLVDGRPLDTLDVHSVRRQIGAVLQNSRPLVGDIFHTIVGARSLTKEDAWRAARQVGLDDEIRDMPMGMHTFVNQRGVTFSGGQRQRLLLARAIVGNPRVLLLDEATSALDNHTQDLVMRSLETMRVTRIVVAHRLSTIQGADRIFVLDGARVVQTGTYQELVSCRGLFRRMAERQVTGIGVAGLDPSRNEESDHGDDMPRL